MGIVGKKQSICRFLGWVIILIGFIFTLIIDSFYLANPLFIIGLILIILLAFITLKFPYDLIKNHRLFFCVISFTVAMIFNIIIYFFTNNQEYFIKYIPIIIANVLLFLTWHYTLSIKKKEKIAYVILFLIYLILSICFKLDLLTGQFNINISIPIIISAAGFSCNFIAETSMRKKGLMKYI